MHNQGHCLNQNTKIIFNQGAQPQEKFVVPDGVWTANEEEAWCADQEQQETQGEKASPGQGQGAWQGCNN